MRPFQTEVKIECFDRVLNHEFLYTVEVDSEKGRWDHNAFKLRIKNKLKTIEQIEPENLEFKSAEKEMVEIYVASQVLCKKIAFLCRITKPSDEIKSELSDKGTKGGSGSNFIV